MVLDRTALRVARRYRAAVVLRDEPQPSAEATYSDGGVITDQDVIRLLKPTLGPLFKLRFRPSLVVDPNGVEFEALDANAELVSGRLVLHAAASPDQVVSWAEIVLGEADDTDTRTAYATGTPREGLLRARLNRIASIARNLLDDARVQPQRPAFSLVEELVRIVEEAES